VHHVGEQLGVARAQRLEHPGVDDGLAHRRDVARVAQPVLVELAVHGGRREPEVGEGEHPLELPLGEGGAELVAAAGADGGAAGEGERHVSAQLGRQLEQVVAPEAGAPERVAGEQRGSRVGGAAAHAAGDGNGLLDAEVDAALVPGGGREEARGTQREVALVGRHPRHVDPGPGGDPHGEVVGAASPHVLVEGHRLVGRRELVVAVVLQVADGEEHVDLARGTGVDHGRAGHGGHGPNLVSSVGLP
jgi:hypothetical protein